MRCGITPGARLPPLLSLGKCPSAPKLRRLTRAGCGGLPQPAARRRAGDKRLTHFSETEEVQEVCF